MPTAQKEAVVELAKDWYQRSSGLIFSDYRGLDVGSMRKLRTSLREKGGEMHVIKNTLFRLAVGDDIEKFPKELHKGPTAVTFIFENESECAKVIVDHAKETKTLEVKGGYIAGKVYDDKQIEALSSLPPKEVLIAQVIGTIAAPLSQLVGTVEAIYAQPIRTIGAVADKAAENNS